MVHEIDDVDRARHVQKADARLYELFQGIRRKHRLNHA